MDNYDVVILGTGQGGMPLAADLCKAGQRVAIVEKGDVGGSCVNFGCTPTKALVHVAKVAEMVRRAKEFGVETKPPVAEMKRICQLVDDLVLESRRNSEKSLEGAELIRGTGSFTGKKTVAINGGRELTADRIVINTGTRARIPEIQGLDSVPYLDNRSILHLDRLPDHLIIMGAGYIGLEFGQMFARLGSKVTILEEGDIFLKNEDRDIADAAMKMLQESGIDFKLGYKVDRIAKVGSQIGVSKSLVGDQLLVAVGRTPNSDDLKLARAGIDADDKGYIKVDDQLKTSADDVFAIGDVKGGPAFTHVSYDDYRILKANWLEGKNKSITGRTIPYVMYTDPELGRIGLNEDQAKEQKVKYRLASMPVSDIARATEMRETKGLIKALIGENDEILGASVLAPQGGEIMSLIQLSMLGGLTAGDLNHAILAHPTMSELLNNLFA